MPIILRSTAFAVLVALGVAGAAAQPSPAKDPTAPAAPEEPAPVLLLNFDEPAVVGDDRCGTRLDCQQLALECQPHDRLHPVLRYIFLIEAMTVWQNAPRALLTVDGVETVLFANEATFEGRDRTRMGFESIDGAVLLAALGTASSIRFQTPTDDLTFTPTDTDRAAIARSAGECLGPA